MPIRTNPSSAEPKSRYARFEDEISRLSIEADLLRKGQGRQIAEFLGLFRLKGDLVLATYFILVTR